MRALGSLGRALALAGEMSEARRVGNRAIDLARQRGDDETMAHVLTASLWHGITPDLAEQQLERSAEISRMSRAAQDYETLGAALNFRATASYVLGRPDDLRGAIEDARSAVEHTGLPYYRFIFCGHSHAVAFLRGDFAGAEHWAQETLKYTETFGDEVAEGPHSVQMFMVHRETGALDRFGTLLDGTETFTARWVPGLLALYTEVGQKTGMRRALRHLLDRELTDRSDEAQWPMELVFLTEAALALNDAETARILQPLLAAYQGMNLVSGTMVATFGSADRYLGRVAALLGDVATAERHLDAALEMDSGCTPRCTPPRPWGSWPCSRTRPGGASARRRWPGRHWTWQRRTVNVAWPARLRHWSPGTDQKGSPSARSTCSACWLPA